MSINFCKDIASYLPDIPLPKHDNQRPDAQEAVSQCVDPSVYLNVTASMYLSVCPDGYSFIMCTLFGLFHSCPQSHSPLSCLFAFFTKAGMLIQISGRHYAALCS